MQPTGTSSSAIAKRSRCRVGQFWPKVEDDILQTMSVYFNQGDAIGMQSYRIRSRSFNVTDVGTNRKNVCDFLLVVNSN